MDIKRSRIQHDGSGYFSREITQDGKTVRIEVVLVGTRQWVLRILGSRGQVSEWTDWFCSSEEAMATGLCAIRFEGIDEFFEDPQFQCLPDGPRGWSCQGTSE